MKAVTLGTLTVLALAACRASVPEPNLEPPEARPRESGGSSSRAATGAAGGGGLLPEQDGTLSIADPKPSAVPADAGMGEQDPPMPDEDAGAPVYCGERVVHGVRCEGTCVGSCSDECSVIDPMLGCVGLCAGLCQGTCDPCGEE